MQYRIASKLQRLMSLACALVVCLGACNNHEEPIIHYTDADPLYFNYRIWGDEDHPYITVMLQFHKENETGKTVLLKRPAGISLDNQTLNPDSSKMSGYFYESRKPLDSFSGKHLIVFTDSTGKSFPESFTFMPFQLASELPATISRHDFAIRLKGLKDLDFIRIIALDTAFNSRGINEVDTVKNGILLVTASSLKGLVNGNIHLELFKEEDWPLNHGTTAGGSLSITYGLKREFTLRD